MDTPPLPPLAREPLPNRWYSFFSSAGSRFHHCQPATAHIPTGIPIKISSQKIKCKVNVTMWPIVQRPKVDGTIPVDWASPTNHRKTRIAPTTAKTAPTTNKAAIFQCLLKKAFQPLLPSSDLVSAKTSSLLSIYKYYNTGICSKIIKQFTKRQQCGLKRKRRRNLNAPCFSVRLSREVSELPTGAYELSRRPRVLSYSPRSLNVCCRILSYQLFGIVHCHLLCFVSTSENRPSQNEKLKPRNKHIEVRRRTLPNCAHLPRSNPQQPCKNGNPADGAQHAMGLWAHYSFWPWKQTPINLWTSIKVTQTKMVCAAAKSGKKIRYLNETEQLIIIGGTENAGFPK